MTTSLPFLQLLEQQINAQDTTILLLAKGKSGILEMGGKRITHPQSTISETNGSLSLLLNTNPLLPLTTPDRRISNLFQGIYDAFQPVRESLVGVWLHGSLATADFTPYSDVDALLVVRDEVLQDEVVYRQVKTAVLAALRHIFLFDPLQHHGFFVATPHTLAAWPAAYLPAAALIHARPLWPIAPPVSLHEHRNPAEEKTLFHNLAQQIYQATPPPNLHKAKGLLSQFMLLPAAYCQAMGNPVYKRESFGLVQEQFQIQWQPMEEASRMRQEWKTPKRPFWSLLLSLTNPWLASRLYRPIERRLPVCHHYPNWMQFIQAMQKLAQAMEQKIV